MAKIKPSPEKTPNIPAHEVHAKERSAKANYNMNVAETYVEPLHNCDAEKKK